MRIIAGSFRSRRLATPVGEKTRPTTDRARESLFNVLQNLVELEGAAVLDLFAGSGALGLEALSRGAESCVMIENDRHALHAIAANIAALAVEGSATLMRGDVYEKLRNLGGSFDVILVDAPYADLRARKSLPQMVVDRNLLTTEGVLVIEHRTGDEVYVPESLSAFRKLEAGEATFTFLKKAADV